MYYTSLLIVVSYSYLFMKYCIFINESCKLKYNLNIYRYHRKPHEPMLKETSLDEFQLLQAILCSLYFIYDFCNHPYLPLTIQ